MLMTDQSGPWAGWQPFLPDETPIEADRALQWAQRSLGLSQSALVPLGQLLTALGQEIGQQAGAARLERRVATGSGWLSLRLVVMAEGS